MHCPKLEKQTPLLNLPQIKGHTFLTCPQAKGQVTNRFCSQVTQNNHCPRLGVRLERRSVHTLVYAIWLSSSSPSSSSQFVGPHCIASSKGFVHPATQTYKTQVNNILIFFFKKKTFVKVSTVAVAILRLTFEINFQCLLTKQCNSTHK